MFKLLKNLRSLDRHLAQTDQCLSSPPSLMDRARSDLRVTQAEALAQAKASSKPKAPLITNSALQQAIFKSINFYSIATDNQGVIQVFNVGAERMLGYSAAEVVNRLSMTDIADPKDILRRAQTLSAELVTPLAPGFEALIFKAERGSEDTYELTLIRQDGSRLPVVVSVSALRDDLNAIVGYLLMGTDNTQHKLTETKLGQSRVLLNAAIEIMPFRVFWKDLDSRFFGCNKLFAKDAGVTHPCAVIGKTDFEFHWKDQAASYRKDDLSVMRSGTSKLDFQEQQTSPEGDMLWLNTSKMPLHDENNQVFGVLCAYQDITEKKKHDLELEGHRNHLEDLVHSRTLELMAARDMADTANRSKARFLANMSHEIRTPLNAILGLAYLLEQSPLEITAQNLVRKIRISGRMLLGIISDILDVSKIEAGKLQLEQAPFSLADVMSNIDASLRALTVDKPIEIILAPLSDDVFGVIGDALRLEQVLLNLGNNAVKFTPAGRVTLRTEVVSCHDDQLILRFSVQDTGIGIAPELQSGVFAAFTQADSSTTRHFGGTGLGLTICRQLVHLMGGDIGFSSSLGLGSEFWFTVPLQKISDNLCLTDSVDLNKPQSPPEGKLEGVRLLIVDDCEINRDVAQSIFSSQGATVSLAVNGQDALDWLLAHPCEVDLVLMDVQMPVMDGLEATRRLRRLPQFDQLPIVALTAGAFKSQQEAAQDAGMSHYISKPFNVPSTVALIQRLCSSYSRPPVNSQAFLSMPAQSVDIQGSGSEMMVLNSAQGMKIWQNKTLYLTSLRRFCDLYGGAVFVMRVSLSEGRRSDAAALAHKLAGVAANLALPETCHIAKEAEQILKTDFDPAQILQRLALALTHAITTIGQLEET